MITALHASPPTTTIGFLTHEYAILQPSAEAPGWEVRAWSPREAGLAGTCGLGGKPVGLEFIGKVFVLKEVIEINASTHG